MWQHNSDDVSSELGPGRFTKTLGILGAAALSGRRSWSWSSTAPVNYTPVSRPRFGGRCQLDFPRMRWERNENLRCVEMFSLFEEITYLAEGLNLLQESKFLSRNTSCFFLNEEVSKVFWWLVSQQVRANWFQVGGKWTSGNQFWNVTYLLLTLGRLFALVSILQFLPMTTFSHELVTRILHTVPQLQ